MKRVIRLTEGDLVRLVKRVINESNVPKHSASYKTHMGNSIPLTPTITKLIFEGKKSVAFHISDIYHIKDLMSLEGTKKPISCFTYYKDMETTKITPHTKGGVVYLLEGDLLFSYNKDAMSSPDESGRRWVSTDNFPHKFQDELLEWRKKNPYSGLLGFSGARKWTV